MQEILEGYIYVKKKDSFKKSCICFSFQKIMAQSSLKQFILSSPADVIWKLGIHHMILSQFIYIQQQPHFWKGICIYKKNILNITDRKCLIMNLNWF